MGAEAGIGREEALMQHVEELRKRLLRIVVFLVLVGGAVFYFSTDLITWIQQDLAFELNALAAYEVIYTRLIMSGIIAFLATLPYTAYHVLMFMKPGLKSQEYRVMRNYLPLFMVLFLGGSVFAYEFIVKSSLQFFHQSTMASDIDAVWGLQDTVLFAVKLSAVTGILFQIPIISAVLSRAGLLTSAMMKEYRAYVVIGVLLIAAVATPPDIITQLLITMPVIGLYQLSILLVARMETGTETETI